MKIPLCKKIVDHGQCSSQADIYIALKNNMYAYTSEK